MAKKYSVLVVDDQENWRELLVELLEDEFDVTSVDSYDAALEKIRERSVPFHVVVTDMRLVDEESGNEDGLKLAEVLNQRADVTNIIVITGYSTLRTAKRALGILDVFDYLEKRPEDGSPFNATEFQHTVCTAAETAEKERPQGLTLSGNRLLLLVPDISLREKMTAILRKRYEVEAVDDFSNIAKVQQILEQPFAVTLMGEELAEKKDFLDVLQETQPQTKIVLLTQQENSVVELLDNIPIAKRISISLSKPDRLQILDGIKQAIYSTAMKYVALEIASPSGEQGMLTNNIRLEPNTTYTLSLKMQDAPAADFLPITLTPMKTGKGQDIVLEVFPTAQQAKIMPSGILRWRITERLAFQIMFSERDTKKLLLEVRQGHRLAGKKEINLQVD